ncbi:MAG TPA: pilus assembly protein N-terminal domain-containing protein [Candidatus Gastranaerophilaceae bacterium]|nr:pilus assembly protein N-terminal domain-containing protein [Candidatus Gastranaerophilaceae bacterium]HPT41949.1 pilus assembly protein N-terminal domain-containing protein [Candidatus Gastranaerophilaceae bacterium]
MVKKIILLTIFLLFGTNCFALESFEIHLGKSYILSTQSIVETIAVSDSEIVNVSPFFTIFNEKNVILVQPLKMGKSNLTIFTGKGDVKFEITVKPSVKYEELPRLQNEIFELLLLDTPPVIDEIKLDEHPIKFERSE